MGSLRLLRSFIPIVLLVASAGALAHSPVDPEEGGTLATATLVEDPSKSWAIYGELGAPGDVWYFEMDLVEGDRLYLSLLSTQEDFLPSLVILGPGLGATGFVPAEVEVPATYGWVVVQGEGDGAEFEPFTPGSYYFVAKYDEKVPEKGKYFVAVHSGEGEGPFSLAVGYEEEFTMSEWLALPASLMGIYRWEGQGWLTILGPPILVILLGLAFLLVTGRRRGTSVTLFQWTSAISGLFILGWASVVLTQMAMALARSGWQASAMVTVGFSLGSLAMAMYALQPFLRGRSVPDRSGRTGMMVVGILALFLYTGLYVGPLMAFISASMPASLAGRSVPWPSLVGTSATRGP